MALFWVFNLFFSEFRCKKNTKKRIFLDQKTKSLRKVSDSVFQTKLTSFLGHFHPNFHEKTRKKTRFSTLFVS
jgi:hypothetical protein